MKQRQTQRDEGKDGATKMHDKPVTRLTGDVSSREILFEQSRTEKEQDMYSIL